MKLRFFSIKIVFDLVIFFILQINSLMIALLKLPDL